MKNKKINDYEIIIVIGICTFTFIGLFLFAMIVSVKDTPKIKSQVHEYKNPFCPRSEHGIVNIADAHNSICKEFDFTIPAPGKDYSAFQENKKNKSKELFKLIEDVHAEIFFQTEQPIKQSHYKTKFWFAAERKVALSICQSVCFENYNCDDYYQSHAPSTYGFYKLSTASPSTVEVFRTDLLKEKIVVGVIDYRMDFASTHKESWFIGNKFGQKKYYGIIKISNFRD